LYLVPECGIMYTPKGKPERIHKTAQSVTNHVHPTSNDTNVLTVLKRTPQLP